MKSEDCLVHVVSIKDIDKPKYSTSMKKWKTYASLVLLFAALFGNYIALAWIHDRVPFDSDPLPDIFFSLFPEYQWAIKITEVLILISLSTMFFMTFLHQHRWIVIRRIFTIASMCYFMRAVCITVTQVPVPSRNTYCDPAANETSLSLVAKRVGWTLTTFGLDLYHKRVLCGDLVFSGHTTVLVLSYMAVKRYMPRKFTWVFYILKFATIVGPICILLARKHYTLDVVLAFIIAPTTFALYHQLAEEKFSHREPSMSTSLWRFYILFMENDVEEIVENQFAFNFVKVKTQTPMYYVI